MDIQALHEPYAYLYVGDYSADTLDLAAREHRALRLLLLETWVRGPVGNVRLAQVAGLTRAEWLEVKPAVLPLLRAVQPRIAQSLKNVRAYDGQRLPGIVWERDGHACVYCGATQALSGDHIVPLMSRACSSLTRLFYLNGSWLGFFGLRQSQREHAVA